MAAALLEWFHVGSWIGRHKAELRLAIRVSVAGLLALLLAEVFNLPQAVWAAITAVIVVQASVGASLKAAMDRLVGTIGGAAVGALAALGLIYVGESWRAVAVFAALVPLALAAALSSSFRVAPVTALILLLGTTAGSPIHSALERVIEIGLGNVVGIAVALLVLPAHAHRLVADAAKRVLDNLAELVPVTLAGLRGAPRPADIDRLYAASRAGLEQLKSASDEARRERRSFLTDEPDPEPLTRTAYRLRADLVMLGRVAAEPIPEPVLAAIEPSLEVGRRRHRAFPRRDRRHNIRAPTPAAPPADRRSLRRLRRCSGFGPRRPFDIPALRARRRPRIRARLRVRAARPGSARSPQSRCRARAATPAGLTASQPPTAFAFGKKSCWPPIL